MTGNIKPHIKRAILILVVIFVSLLQFTSGAMQDIFGFGIFYILPTVVCISMFQGETVSMICGLLGGILWDLVSAQSYCYHAVFLTVSAFFISFIIQRRVRNSFRASLLLNGAVILLHNLLYWFIFVLIRTPSGAASALFKFYLPCSAITFGIGIPVYFIIRAIHRGFRKM